MEKMIAYCGLVCTECEAFVATQAGDLAALEKMAASTREQFNIPDLTANDVACDGCLAESNQLCRYCFTCGVRACATQRSVANCAYCDDYACQTLEDFFGMAAAARPMLDQIRAGLAA